MDINKVFELYKKRYDLLRQRTSKKLFIQDIREHRICNSFYKLGFIIKYFKSFRPFKNNLFLQPGPDRDQVNKYFGGLTVEKQKENIECLYNKLHKYSLEVV